MQEDLGLSTEQLAEQAGLSPHLLARIENGTSKGDEWGVTGNLRTGKRYGCHAQPLDSQVGTTYRIGWRGLVVAMPYGQGLVMHSRASSSRTQNRRILPSSRETLLAFCAAPERS
jgi:hypothetical protein